MKKRSDLQQCDLCACEWLRLSWHAGVGADATEFLRVIQGSSAGAAGGHLAAAASPPQVRRIIIDLTFNCPEHVAVLLPYT